MMDGPSKHKQATNGTIWLPSSIPSLGCPAAASESSSPPWSTSSRPAATGCDGRVTPPQEALLSPPALAHGAAACNVSRADVHGVLTFYTDLRTSPPPDVPVRLCAAEACQSVGGRELTRDWERRCGESAELAEATGTDEPVFCLGNCALAPAALVGGVLVGRATVEKVESMVRGSLQESP